MIDSAARSSVRTAIEEYLFDRITAFQFDERLFAIRTDDETVEFVIRQLWYIYDDCQDHLVHADKRTWDSVQRLLLLMDSGAELTTSTRMYWHVSQVIAGFSLVMVVGLCVFLWPIVFVVLGSGGIVAAGLRRWRQEVRDSLHPPDPWLCWPFPSLAVLRCALTATPGFAKVRHRPEVAARRVRSSLGEFGVRLQWLLAQVLFSPVALFVQSLPIRQLTLQVQVARAVR